MATKQELAQQVKELQAELDQKQAQEEEILDLLGVELIEDDDEDGDLD